MRWGHAVVHLRPGVPAGSIVWRHPLICLGVLIAVIGFVWDAILEVTFLSPLGAWRLG
jgi:hypothetical protein